MYYFHSTPLLCPFQLFSSCPHFFLDKPKKVIFIFHCVHFSPHPIHVSAIQDSSVSWKTKIWKYTTLLSNIDHFSPWKAGQWDGVLCRQNLSSFTGTPVNLHQYYIIDVNLPFFHPFKSPKANETTEEWEKDEL